MGFVTVEEMIAAVERGELKMFVYDTETALYVDLGLPSPVEPPEAF